MFILKHIQQVKITRPRFSFVVSEKAVSLYYILMKRNILELKFLGETEIMC
jgi:hypothetical protein